MEIFLCLAFLLLGFTVATLVFWLNRLRNQINTQKQESEPSPAELLEQKMTSLMKGFASDAMQAATKNFLELAKSQLTQESEMQKKEVQSLVKPLSDSLNLYKRELDDAEAKRNKEYGSLDRLLKTVAETNQQLKTETAHLAGALRRPTVRGRWGEIQLRRIVELSGMSERCDFAEQVSVEGEDGRLRPDMLVHLPNGRKIIVDSKAVLTGYLDAEAATDEQSRKQAITRHAAAVKTRIFELSRKNYWDQFKEAPEFVVLFIPGESFFSAAVEEAPDLVEVGFEQKVVLATPTTLMALLRAVAFGWRQEQLAENSKRISEQASRIYQGLSTWTEHLSNIGVSLDRAAKSYNAAVGSLERTVMPPVKRLKELGVSSKDELKEIHTVDTALRETRNNVNEVASEESSSPAPENLVP